MEELNKMDLSKEFKDLPENFIVSVIVPTDNYEEVNMHILNRFIGEEDKHGIYITLNRPYDNIIELMKKDKIDIKKLSFIDCISKEIKKTKGNVDCIFVRSPADLTEIAVALDDLFERNKHGFIFFDSLDTLLFYNKLDRVIKFIHFITGKMRIYDIKGILLGLHEKTTEELIGEIAPFTDKIIKLA